MSSRRKRFRSLSSSGAVEWRAAGCPGAWAGVGGTTRLALALTRGACIGDSASAKPVGGFEVDGGGFIQTNLGNPYRYAYRPTVGLEEALPRGTPVGGHAARHNAMDQLRVPDAVGPCAFRPPKPPMASTGSIEHERTDKIEEPYRTVSIALTCQRRLAKRSYCRSAASGCSTEQNENADPSVKRRTLHGIWPSKLAVLEDRPRLRARPP